MKDDRPESRKSTAPCTSSGRPYFPTGVLDMILFPLAVAWPVFSSTRRNLFWFVRKKPENLYFPGFRLSPE